MNAWTRLVAGGTLLLLAAGCQTARPLYYWGHYEEQLYQDYAKPGKTGVEEQIQALQEDLAKAAAANLAVHPGLHAQLGYLYLSKGQVDAARSEFEAEKAQFPESAVLMDRLLGKLTSPTKP